MDNTYKFSHKADAYSLGRPSYANAFIDMLYTEQGFCDRSVIADIGSGTGILSRQLLERGSTVYAVEPNDDMRASAEKKLSDCDSFHSVNGTAENTTLDNNFVDYITVAQAFHWFEVKSFKKECNRIIKPSGKIFLIWNIRDDTAEVNIKHGEVFKKFCPSFAGFSGGIKHNDDRISSFFDNKFERVEFDNPLFYDREKFIQRSLSASYSLSDKDENYNAYIQALNGFFDKHAVNGILTVPNKTVAYYNKV